ncbi:ribosomal protein 49 [Stylonychia lemnae]|uniref:Ribosomal protein 49 n=1 Tax=Stylonychia lemnae TaxID=5949 RepID=A0A078A655_STYLE|nr:ribosomal protein 49 [Stylonychia lemnae]|eukprot:CDW77679.1 ribosomal protein 49 [Stylonychia lemnae]
MAVQPLNKTKIIKKITKHPNRFQSDKYYRVGASWRKPHGIDSRIRRKYRGNQMMPGVGQASNRKTRHLLPNGFKKLLIRSPKDIELLLMNNRTYCAEIANTISGKNRKAIVQRAKELNVRLTNSTAKLRKQTAE